jgi:hypothetical protein
MTVTLTPILEQDAVQLSQDGKWRKQILPTGKFNYNGKVLDFDEIGPEVVSSFSAKAANQVAFQLADSGNNHNFDPKNYRGELINVEYKPGEGTFGTFDLSQYPDVQELVKKNPNFGVSARIEQDRKSGNGKTFKYAFSHVLGTLDPKVVGMKPWEKVDLSNVDDPDAEVVDLSTEKGEKVTPTNTDDVKLTPELIAALQAFAKEQEELKEFASLANGSEINEPDPAIKLAQEQADNAMKLAREGQREAAAERWERQSLELANSGVPPVALEKAAPLMKAAKFDVHTIELSNGNKLDPQAVMLEMLESLKGTVDLSEPKGHTFSGEDSGTGADDESYKNFRDAFFNGQWS